MDTWAGFTDRELKRLKNSAGGPQDKGKIPSTKRQQRQSHRPLTEPSPSTESNHTSPPSSTEPSIHNASRYVDSEQDKPKPTAHSLRNTQTTEDSEEKSSPDKEKVESVNEANDVCRDGEYGSNGQSKNGATTTLVTPEVKEANLADEPVTNLDSLQKKQKEIEEENKKKKTLLHQAIAERYQRTTAEAKILTTVQVELDKIDLLLSNDVIILRNKIEDANRAFELARQRFESAEKEYISAKLGLHKASEEKELLAEHLYTIIQQNELRKASKLNELMGKLELGIDEGDRTESSNVAPLLAAQRTPTPAISMSQVSRGLGVKVKGKDAEHSGVVPVVGEATQDPTDSTGTKPISENSTTTCTIGDTKDTTSSTI